jgi:hypothetical protein
MKVTNNLNATRKNTVIKKSNPIAKEVRTPKFKPRVIASKKIYNRKRLKNDWY